MDIIARLVRAALEACFAHGKINWLPAEGYGMPASFQAECEIEFNGYWIGTSDDGYLSGDVGISMLGVFCLVGLEDITDDNCTYWHSEVLPEATSHA